MSSHIALATSEAVRMGVTNVQMVAMHSEHGASIALIFTGDRSIGLSAQFHGSTEEMRAFAAELIRHADAAEAAMAKSEEVTA